MTEHHIPGTIVHQRQPDGGRDLAAYEAQLQFNRHLLEGKRVLDLGAGPNLNLARELRQQNIGAKVVSLSPDFANEIHHPTRRGISGMGVAAVGQALPFATESFDIVLALHVHEHLRREDIAPVLGEMARVLASQGIGKMGPVPDLPHDWGSYEDVIKDPQLPHRLGEYGVTITKEPIPLDVIEPITLKDAYDNRHYNVTSCIITLNKE